MQKKRYSTKLAQQQLNLAFVDWGERGNARNTIICVHGLTRNSRDFDTLASHLAENFRVLCPDVVGRGQSDWLDNKMAYVIPTYVEQIQELLRRQGVKQLDWIGTSMGGLIGMTLAAQPNSPIRRLILNDIGPFLPKSGLSNILDSLIRSDQLFPSLAALKEHIRANYASFGNLSEAQWDHMTYHSALPQPGGGYRMAYDPGIRAVFESLALEDIALWDIWERISCPVLVLRGEESALLLKAVAQRMAKTGPRARVVEIRGVGHAPALLDTEQLAVAIDWLCSSLEM